MAGPNQTKTSAPPWYHDRKAKTSGPEQQKMPTTASQVGMMLHSLTVNRSLIYMKGSICGKMGRILLDSGASVNCVSSKWARDNKLTLMNLAKTAEVRMADGTTYQGRMQVKDAAINIGKYQGKATFIELPLPDIDVILGMPWLKQVNPSIDWITARVATRDGCILHRGKSGSRRDWKAA
jgi:predicted aspartyl protease